MFEKRKKLKRDRDYFEFRLRLLTDPFYIAHLHDRIDAEIEKTNISELYDHLEKKRDGIKKYQAVLDQIKKRLDDAKKRQDSCSHLKGGRGISSPAKDFNIANHIFPDGVRKVKCLTCKKEWSGDQLKLPEVIHMLENTTNTRTASEVHISGNPNPKSGPVVSYHSYIDFKESEEREDENRKNNPAWPWMGKKRWEWLNRIYIPFAQQKKLDKQLDKQNKLK